jgi:hypothetical protein
MLKVGRRPSEVGSLRGSPPVFLEMQILKDFKSCVLELRIPKGLRVVFAEVQILKELRALLSVAHEEWRETRV